VVVHICFFWLLYDQRYISATYYIQLLLIPSIFVLLTHSSVVTLILIGNLRTTLVANIIRLSWSAIAMPLGYNYFRILGLLIAIALIEICPAIYVTIKLKMIGIIHIRKEAGLKLVQF
jgi:hypothetical protein